MLKRIIGFFKFFFAIWVTFYFYSTLSCLVGIFICRPKISQKLWSSWSTNFLNVKVKYHPDSKQIAGPEKKTMLLVTHRCWADFFISDVVCHFQGSFLSRLAVAIAFPVSYIFNITFGHSVWFFRRGNTDFKKFYAWLD
jgi:hypothetical protein